MTHSVLVRYNGTAVGSSESFAVSQHPPLLFPMEERALLFANKEIANYGNPTEPYHVLLDGGVVPIPKEREGVNFGMWTVGRTGTFELFLEASAGLFSVSGITVTFDDVKGIFPKQASFTFLREGEEIATFSHETEEGYQFFPMIVEFFDAVRMQFSGMNVPNSRLWVKRIDFGLVTDFGSKDIRNAKEAFSISPIALTLPVNTFSMTVVAPEDITFMFERTQPLEVYFNGKLQSVNFITSAKRRSDRVYDVEAEDYIGVLDGAVFEGGFYEGILASSLIRLICRKANVPVSFDASFSEQQIWGYLPYGSCREALQQVLFVCAATAITSESKTLKIINAIAPTVVTVSNDRILRSPSLETSQRVTAVEVTTHAYKRKEDEYVTIFDSEVNAVGNNIKVVFPEPLHSLDVYDGQILESGDNYVIFNAGNTCFIEGKTYEHLTQVHRQNNPLVLSTDIENVKQVMDCTLVTAENIDKVLGMCYDYYTSSASKGINAKIVERLSDNGESIDSPLKLGCGVSLNTDVTDGEFFGRVEQQKYSLNGGILVKESMIR